MSVKANIFFDMDGTTSMFYEHAQCVELMGEEGFFRNLNPYANTVKAIRLLKALAVKDAAFNVFMLSAVSADNRFEKAEKGEWLDEHIGTIGYFLVPSGVSKSQYIADYYGRPLRKTDVLVDDYSKNLIGWEIDGGKSVKFRNEINSRGTNGYNFVGDSVHYTETPAKIAHAVLASAGIDLRDAVQTYMLSPHNGEYVSNRRFYLGSYFLPDEAVSAGISAFVI